MTTDADLPALPERDWNKSGEEQGLFRKFDVRRCDGSDTTPLGKHYGCDYFVLDVTHDQHARAALAAYADAVEATHPLLASDMRAKYKLAAIAAERKRAIDMVMYCPNCGMQHIDAPEFNGTREDKFPAFGEDPAMSWTNPPHRSHLCHGCGCIWRPADVPTNGVAEIKTEGKADSWPVNADEISAQRAGSVDVRVVEDAERYRWLLDWLESQGLLRVQFCQPDAGVKAGDYWVLSNAHMVTGCAGYGKSEDAAIDAARSKP